MSQDPEHTNTPPEELVLQNDGAEVGTADGGYHHGALRDALIAAANDLVREKGAEQFTMAAASRRAGVSTAAPYRHFKDREELIAEVTARAFETLTERVRAARLAHPPGSIEGLIAMGRAYVRFVGADPEIFHLMWGAAREGYASESVSAASCEGFSLFLETCEQIWRARDLTHIPLQHCALTLWAQVHGLASLSLGRTTSLLEGADPDACVAHMTYAYFAGLEALKPPPDGASEGAVG